MLTKNFIASAVATIATAGAIGVAIASLVDNILKPLLGRRPVVYILPETRTLDEVFALRPRSLPA